MEELDLRTLAFRESEQVEWKENVADIEDVVATLSAFANDWANLGGGYVVCGAAEGRDEHGFAVLHRRGLDAARFKEVHGKVLQLCRDQVTPPIVPLVHELPTEDPSRRILVFVMPATRQAHSFRRRLDGGSYYIRQSRSTIKARNGFFRELMVRKGDFEPWDLRVSPGARVDDVDLLVLRDTLQRLSAWDAIRGVDDYLRPDQRIFAMVPALCTSEPLTTQVRPRNYALLLFGRDVPRYVGGAYVVFSVYPGVDRSEPYNESLWVTGPLLEQVRVLKNRLAEQATLLVDKTDPVAPNRHKYPVRALEEAVVNALVHRDYEIYRPIHVTAFIDRVEIVSPGTMPSAVDHDAFREGTSTPVWRNQTLAWFCAKLEIAQAQGQGVKTILRTMEAAGCPPPEFALRGDVRCTLYAHPRATRGALVVAFEDRALGSDVGPGFLAVVGVPAAPAGRDWSCLHVVPVDIGAWQQAMTEIDDGVARVLKAVRGELHVFASAPLAAAAYLGRRIAELAGDRPVIIHQRARGDGGWEVFSRPNPASYGSIEPYFAPLEGPPSEARAAASVVLAIDCIGAMEPELLDRASSALGATTYRLVSRAGVGPHALQAASALVAFADALATIATRHPGAPLHIVAAAPAPLMVELGRRLDPAVFPSVIVHEYVPATGYVPVLDVSRRAVVTSSPTPP
jgi:ATP-dependent DNA helicase RecG